MKTINTFIDTSTVNRILEIDTSQVKDALYEEDRLYLSKIIKEYVERSLVQLIVNPSVKLEIENTPDRQKRERLLALYNQFRFTAYNTTIFPFTFPATFLTNGEKKTLEELLEGFPSFKKDMKIFADAIFNSEVEVLLTTDREHLANNKFHHHLEEKGLDKKVKVFTPKEFFEYLRKGAV